MQLLNKILLSIIALLYSISMAITIAIVAFLIIKYKRDKTLFYKPLLNQYTDEDSFTDSNSQVLKDKIPSNTSLSTITNKRKQDISSSVSNPKTSNDPDNTSAHTDNTIILKSNDENTHVTTVNGTPIITQSNNDKPKNTQDNIEDSAVTELHTPSEHSDVSDTSENIQPLTSHSLLQSQSQDISTNTDNTTQESQLYDDENTCDDNTEPYELHNAYLTDIYQLSYTFPYIRDESSSNNISLDTSGVLSCEIDKPEILQKLCESTYLPFAKNEESHFGNTENHWHMLKIHYNNTIRDREGSNAQYCIQTIITLMTVLQGVLNNEYYTSLHKKIFGDQEIISFYKTRINHRLYHYYSKSTKFDTLYSEEDEGYQSMKSAVFADITKYYTFIRMVRKFLSQKHLSFSCIDILLYENHKIDENILASIKSQGFTLSTAVTTTVPVLTCDPDDPSNPIKFSIRPNREIMSLTHTNTGYDSYDISDRSSDISVFTNRDDFSDIDQENSGIDVLPESDEDQTNSTSNENNKSNTSDNDNTLNIQVLSTFPIFSFTYKFHTHTDPSQKLKILSTTHENTLSITRNHLAPACAIKKYSTLSYKMHNYYQNIFQEPETPTALKSVPSKQHYILHCIIVLASVLDQYSYNSLWFSHHTDDTIASMLSYDELQDFFNQHHYKTESGVNLELLDDLSVYDQLLTKLLPVQQECCQVLSTFVNLKEIKSFNFIDNLYHICNTNNNYIDDPIKQNTTTSPETINTKKYFKPQISLYNFELSTDIANTFALHECTMVATPLSELFVDIQPPCANLNDPTLEQKELTTDTQKNIHGTFD